MKNNLLKLSALSIATSLVLSLTGCGGDDTSSHLTTTQEHQPVEATGQFIDAAVANLDVYQNGKKIDTTDSEGKFTYMTGSEVTFKLGKLILGSTMPKAIVTPADLSASSDNVVEILQTLQSLDEDNDPTNGIFIPQTTIDKLVTALDLSEDDVSIMDTLKKDIPDLTLVSVEDALEHFGMAQDILKQSSNYSQAADKLAGYWYLDDCDQKEKIIFEFSKVADNSVQIVGGLVNKYANEDCSGDVISTSPYIPQADEVKWTVVGMPSDNTINVLFGNDYDQGQTIPAYLSTFRLNGDSLTISSEPTDETYNLQKLDSLALPDKEALADIDIALASLNDGWWYEEGMCHNKSMVVSKYGKTAENTISIVDAVLVTYENSGCTGNIIDKEPTTADDVSFVVNSASENNGVTTINTPAITININGDTMKNSYGMTFYRVTENEFAAVDENDDIKTVEQAVDTMVGYWKSDCIQYGDKSEIAYVKVNKVNGTTIKSDPIISKEYNNNSCADAPVEVSQDKPDTVDLSQEGLPAFNGNNQFTVEYEEYGKQMQETYNRITQSEFESLVVEVEENKTVPEVINAEFTPATDSSQANIVVTFNTDMSDDYYTTGSYSPSKSYWKNNRNFIVEFNSYTPGGAIKFAGYDMQGRKGFQNSSGEVMKNDYTFTFPN